ncbi:MAG: hypothetical protein QME57_02035 [Patescibacteria group bacterium]|nr:hypothetical protein [Patescibacteria group bacterium]
MVDSNFHPDYLEDIERMIKDKRVQKIKKTSSIPLWQIMGKIP